MVVLSIGSKAFVMIPFLGIYLKPQIQQMLIAESVLVKTWAQTAHQEPAVLATVGQRFPCTLAASMQHSQGNCV